MARGLFMVFAAAAYCVFLAVFLYLVGFVGNLPYLPLTIDRGPAAPEILAAVIDLALIALFGVQHSVMARQGFKRAWTRIVPPPIERSTYVLVSSLVLIAMFMLWRPITQPIWTVESPVAAYLLWGVFAAGWAVALLSTYLLNHFELFGLQQVWLNFTGKTEAAPKLRQPLFYKLVRHPLYSGFLLAFWAIPVMTIGHLLFAMGMTIYILIAITHEERDLTDAFGDDYRAYQRKVGSVVPGIGKKRG